MRALRTVALVWPIIKGNVTRLGLTILLGSSLAVALGMIYPIQREIGVGGYVHSGADVEAMFVLPESHAELLTRRLGTATCLSAGWLTSLSTTSGVASPVDIAALEPTCDASVAPFPPVTLLGSIPTPNGPWVDLSADTAKDLGVNPGSIVEVMSAPGVPGIPATVRGVYAVRFGAPYSAQAPSSLLKAAQPSGMGLAYSTLYVADQTVDQVTQLLSGEEFRPILEASKYFPPVVLDHRTILTRALAIAETPLGLVRVIGLLALLGGVALTVRELDVFRRGLRPALALVFDLGGSVRAFLGVAYSIAGAIAVLCLLLGATLGTGPFAGRMFASGFPATQQALLVGCVAIAVGVTVLTSALFATSTLRAAVGRS